MGNIKIMLLLIASLSAGISSYSTDLYLMEISSQAELDAAGQIVEYAHGTIDGKFILELHPLQARRLSADGIMVTAIARNVTFEDCCLIDKIHADIADAPNIGIPLYSAGGSFLVEINGEQRETWRKAGYIIRPLAERKTPLFYHPMTIPVPLRDSYPADTIADFINQDSLYNYLTRLEAFRTRFMMTDSINAARNWLMQKFEEFGYVDVSAQLFHVTDPDDGIYNHPCHNVICYKYGAEQPEKLLVVGAHYDSYNMGPSDLMQYAPGADDNASGTAGVLELARVFKDIDTRKTMVFIAFSAEEVGLYGSEYCAQQMSADSTDIELMINFDMIAYEKDTIPNFDLAYSCPTAYCRVFEQASQRVAGLIPNSFENAYCDARSFGDYGYDNISPIEADICPSVHSDYDVSDSCDFAYMEKIVRTTAAAMGIIDASPDPVACEIRDIGDGQSLRIFWCDGHENLNFELIYGTAPDQLHDTITITPPACSCDLQDLVEGQEYFVALMAFTADGYNNIALLVSSLAPLSVPRKPAGVTAEPDSAAVVLSWNTSVELDLNHYKILRRETTQDWSLYIDYYSDTIFIDTNVQGQTEYFYRIIAVDHDLNESDSSSYVRCFPATFDGGILVVDETQTGGINPSQPSQMAFLDSVFGEVSFATELLDSSSEALTRNLAGQYNPIFWIDDDDFSKLLENSLDTLRWYFEFNTDLMIAGWQTIHAMTGNSYFYSGNFFYDYLGISYINQNIAPDFIGATGVGGWPDLEIKPEAPYNAHLPNIDIFAAASGAEAIYTFNSFSSHPYYSDKPVGIACDSYHGKRIVLGFPLYWLTESSAEALVAKVLEYFAEESVLYGDVNGDWSVDILDITFLINFLYKSGPSPSDMNNGDPDGSCTINILDVAYLINYLYKGGAEPLAGCVY